VIKFVVLGTTEITLSCAKSILDGGNEVCLLVSMPSKLLPGNSTDISDFAAEYEIPYHEADDINSPESVCLLQDHKPDYIFSCWPRILKKKVLEIPEFYCIGSHPTELPFNRGRHPLHWLIVLNINNSVLSLFRLDEKIDNGNILVQTPFYIENQDEIKDVIRKMNSAAHKATCSLVKKLNENPNYSGQSQNSSKANYWRKRNRHDLTLDMRLSSGCLMRIIRSFAPPFPCANLIFENQVLKITAASISQIEIPTDELKRIEPGKVIYIKGSKIGIKTDDSILDLTCLGEIPHSLAIGKYIHPPTKYLTDHPDELMDKIGLP